LLEEQSRGASAYAFLTPSNSYDSILQGPMTDWNSALYMKFESERTRAARDLVAQIPAFNPSSIFDLGCGPGNGTELLAAAFPSATIVGLDLSDNMLAVARTRVAIAQFVKQDIESWRPVEKRTSSSPMRHCISCPTTMNSWCGSSPSCTRAGGSRCRCQTIFKSYRMLDADSGGRWALGEEARPYRQDTPHDRCTRFILPVVEARLFQN
jgi:SAM-dependent methyltransferase